MDIKKLSPNTVVLTRAIKINGFISLEFASRVPKPQDDVNFLQMFNHGDSRFENTTTAYTWMNANPESASKLFGLDKDVLEKLSVATGAEKIEGVNFITVNKVVDNINGHRPFIQIVETIEKPNDYAKPKVNITTGEILTANGKPIYRVTSLTTNPKHVFLAADKISKEIFGEQNTVAQVLNVVEQHSDPF